MDTYTVATVLIVCLALATLLASYVIISRWLRQRTSKAEAEVEAEYWAYQYNLNDSEVQLAHGDPTALDVWEQMGVARARGQQRIRQIRRLLSVLNIVTTILAMVPIGFALYSLITHQPQQALNFSIGSIAAVILKIALIPMLKGVFSFFGGLIAKSAYERWKKNKAQGARQ